MDAVMVQMEILRSKIMRRKILGSKMRICCLTNYTKEIYHGEIE
jgi:hypothetical protein